MGRVPGSRRPQKPASTRASRAAHALFMQEWRRRRRAAALLKKSKSARKKVVRLSGPHRCRLDAPLALELDAARLRRFQHWFRETALLGHRRYQESPDLVRSLRMPLKSPAAWLAALIAYWWMDDFARDAVGWLLTDAEPDWDQIKGLLRCATTVAQSGAVGTAGPRYRRGHGAVPAGGCAQNSRMILSLQRWHNMVVIDGGLSRLVRAIRKPRTPSPRMTTSCAAGCLSHVRGIGQYLAKNVMATMVAHGLLEFDIGIVGPGALATVVFLRGGPGTLQSPGLWPDDNDTGNVRGAIAHLARLEGCHWLDMQHALCLWRSSGSFHAVPARSTF